MTPPPFFLFPGQGAQMIGMGAAFANHSPTIAALFSRASKILGFDLLSVCTNGPLPLLTRSSVAQPAIFTVSAAATAALAPLHLPPPAGAAGLSSGEWAALYAANALSFDDTIRVLHARGSFMQDACDATPGGMLSIIGLPPQQVQTIARQTGLEVANYNSPLQTVLSGHLHRIPAAAQTALAAGAKRAIPLNVAGAFHSSLMKPAASRFADFLRSVPIQTPAFPVWSNVTATPHAAPDDIRRLMVQQIIAPVRWSDSFSAMITAGMSRAYELGPGSILTRLARRIPPPIPVSPVSDPNSLRLLTTIPHTPTP